ncbi:hypothetical protein TrLO_g14758 [Triparma laevis f. longispina]|uniref:Uncharacterized protein n=1 Tax=Triparma laevis f. longispina TaxID=1714387 RepID=A0A9W7FGU0_9STRA|nr:hypothetical protein TrLO_g14758 [Triparma laevis f. longispina]
MSTVGIALSGGGITGIVAGLSTFNSFVTRVYDASSKPNLIASTVSGGTIGFGIHANAGSKLTYQLYDSGISYDVANSEVKEDGKIWYANVVNYLNWAPFLTGEASERKTTMTGAMQSGWWTDVIDLMFWEGYSIHDYDIAGSDLYNWHANFALLDKGVCPISRNDDGVMKKAEEGLVYASMDMSSGEKVAANNATLEIKHDTVLDVMSYSSSFWTASIVEDKTQYFFLKGSISTGTLGGEDVYLNDGGIVDTTGIVTLLQKKVPKIVAFYNNNDPLSSLSSVFAYLFGVEVETDTMNSLEGWELGQVFDSGLYEEVLTNLTDPTIMRAHLTNLQVMDNTFLGVEGYAVEEIMILSNEYSDEFLDSFNNAEDLKGGLDEKWPNQFPVSIPTFDCNMLAMKADWLVLKYEEELAALVG